MDAGKRISVSWLAFISLLPIVATKTGPSHGKVVVCYISTWGVYRPGHGAYSIENFNPNLCTHAVYAFAGLDIVQSAIKSLDPWQDLKEEYGKGGYERLTSLKRTHPHLKVSLAIGGWNEGSKNYSDMVANPQLRGKFVKQVTSFIRKYDFDGLDLDWEYPTQRGGVPADRENFVSLTKELREEFDRYNLLLTSAIGAAKHVIDQAYDIRQISRYLDYLHIMCYDYHGSWDKKIGYNAPLTTVDRNDVLSVEYTINYILKLGAPKDKVVMGLPFYGRTFKTPFEGRVGENAEGVGFQGPYTREDGFLGYNEICHILSNKSLGWTTIWDGQTSQMLAHAPRESDGLVRVVTYDNPRAIANKVRFAILKDLAGVMIWSVDTDDFRGECLMEENAYADFGKYRKAQKMHQSPEATIPQKINTNYPLLHTVNEAVVLALEEVSHQLHPDRDHKPDVSENEIPLGDINDRKASTASRNLTNSPICLGILLILNTIFGVAMPLHH